MTGGGHLEGKSIFGGTTQLKHDKEPQIEQAKQSQANKFLYFYELN